MLLNNDDEFLEGDIVLIKDGFEYSKQGIITKSFKNIYEINPVHIGGDLIKYALSIGAFDNIHDIWYEVCSDESRKKTFVPISFLMLKDRISLDNLLN